MLYVYTRFTDKIKKNTNYNILNEKLGKHELRWTYPHELRFIGSPFSSRARLERITRAPENIYRDFFFFFRHYYSYLVHVIRRRFF